MTDNARDQTHGGGAVVGTVLLGLIAHTLGWWLAYPRVGQFENSGAHFSQIVAPVGAGIAMGWVVVLALPWRRWTALAWLCPLLLVLCGGATFLMSPLETPDQRAEWLTMMTGVGLGLGLALLIARLYDPEVPPPQRRRKAAWAAGAMVLLVLLLWGIVWWPG